MDAHDLTVYDVLPEVEFFLEHQSTDVNGLIYATFEIIAERFLETVVKKRIKRFRTAEYGTFTNYLDSHVWFEDRALDTWFNDWRSRLE